MNILSEREAQIVEMRFGLADGNQMTLEEIGNYNSNPNPNPYDPNPRPSSNPNSLPQI
jgi:hypothetical protein